ncbi:hypothetical protein JCM17724A_04350 [Prevotella fusca JCM 17724]
MVVQGVCNGRKIRIICAIRSPQCFYKAFPVAIQGTGNNFIIGIFFLIRPTEALISLIIND